MAAKTKEEKYRESVIKALTKAEIEFDPEASIEELEALIPEDIDTSEAVSVEFQGGVREFSKEIHGKDFKKVAEEFAETHKGKILK